METLLCCPVCEKTDIITSFSCIDRVVTNELFQIQECKNCSLLFTNPRPTCFDISRYYKSENYVSHNSKKDGIIYSIYNFVRNFSIKQKISLLKKYHSSGNLLDIGCGLGYFLNGVVKDRTFDAVGVDTSEEAIKYVKENFGVSVSDEASISGFAKNSYDIITMWHVLEHVHNLSDRIKELKRILKPNGTIFIAVPNSKSWDAAFFKENWDAYDVPRHLYHFNQNSFRVLMEKYGFKIIDTRPLFFDAPYVSMRSVLHGGGGAPFIVGALLGLFSNLRAIKNQDYSSLLFVIKNKDE